jgi:hypothetical protein
MENHFQPTATRDAEVPSQPNCFVCAKPIIENEWFCRLTQEGTATDTAQPARILLCSPKCALRHFAVPTPVPVPTTN